MTSQPKRGRGKPRKHPDAPLVTFGTRVRPATLDEIDRLKTELGVSRGEVIDRLVAGKRAQENDGE